MGNTRKLKLTPDQGALLWCLEEAGEDDVFSVVDDAMFGSSPTDSDAKRLERLQHAVDALSRLGLIEIAFERKGQGRASIEPANTPVCVRDHLMFQGPTVRCRAAVLHFWLTDAGRRALES